MIETRLRTFARLNPDLCNDAWRGASLKPSWKFPLLEGIARLFLFTAKEAFSRRTRPPRCRVLIGVGGPNAYRSASDVLEQIPDAAIFTVHNLKVPCAPRLNLASTFATGWLGVLLLPLLLMRERRPHVRRALVMRLDRFALGMGRRRNVRRFLARSGADVFVTMSHVTVYENLLVDEARRLGMKTVLMTHAPLSRGQCPLETDYALLDGDFHQSLFPHSATKVIVTGSLRGRKLTEHRRDRSLDEGIIIATNNLMTDLSLVEDLAEKLRRRYPSHRIVVRPSPADWLRFSDHRKICEKSELTYADPSAPLWEAAAGCKYLVTGISGVAVDALLVGLYPLLLRSAQFDVATADLPIDYHGLLELGLAKEIDANTPELPAEWVLGSEVEALDRSACEDWPTSQRVKDAFALITAAGPQERHTRGASRLRTELHDGMRLSDGPTTGSLSRQE